ncbi:hypothetical protein BGZ65_004036 [Modicella reniformis]|uniref:Centromere protein H C-terminal domain-containing protein n=1 Tax=Modicella reniformis TaxID=1440133 RepID=A0A9P6M906_9FUNG|nr:hypothetical protein BGZ65_004036 [Modicella reniformis]
MTLTVAEELMDAGLIPTLENQILQLADHEAWLDAQIRELEFANSQGTKSESSFGSLQVEWSNRLIRGPLQTDSQSSSNEGLSPEETRRNVEQRIDLLKQELLTAASLESVRAKVVDSAHYYQVVLSVIFKDDKDPEEKYSTDEYRLLADAIQERDTAVSEYLRTHRELQQARQELSASQIQVLDCQDDNRKLVQLLSNETAAAKEATVSRDSDGNRRAAQRMEEELKKVIVKEDIVSNVLQGLLLESGVDWVNDPHYLDVMLKLKRTAE